MNERVRSLRCSNRSEIACLWWRWVANIVNMFWYEDGDEMMMEMSLLRRSETIGAANGQGSSSEANSRWGAGLFPGRRGDARFGIMFSSIFLFPAIGTSNPDYRILRPYVTVFLSIFRCFLSFLHHSIHCFSFLFSNILLRVTTRTWLICASMTTLCGYLSIV